MDCFRPHLVASRDALQPDETHGADGMTNDRTRLTNVKGSRRLVIAYWSFIGHWSLVISHRSFLLLLLVGDDLPLFNLLSILQFPVDRLVSPGNHFLPFLQTFGDFDVRIITHA